MIEESKMDLDSSDTDVDEESIIGDFEEKGKLIINKLLPAKSCVKYENTYNGFMKWKTDNKATSFDENVLIVYFEELTKKLKPSTLWCQWSMLRTTLNLRHGININKYEHLKTLIKNKNKGFKAKKSSVLTWDQIKLFLTQSDDLIYLCAKVILIFGICGAMRCHEFCNISISDVENTGTQFIVTLRDSKNHYPRNFIIGSELYDKVNDYIKLRPNHLNTDRFFLQYKNGMCVRQVIGRNKVSEVPKTIATFLNLKDPETYTGHCLRRTATTLLANSGVNLTTVKQLDGWKSSSVSEGYIEHSLANKRKIFQGVINSDNSSMKKNLPTTTLPVSTVTTASTIQVDSACNRSPNVNALTKNLSPVTPILSVDDADKYPPFDTDDIDESSVNDESNVSPGDKILVNSIKNEFSILEKAINVPEFKMKMTTEMFTPLYKNNQLFDVTFIIGDEKIQAHAVVLAATCPYFCKMFSNGMKEQHERIVDLTKDDEITAEIFRGFLDYIYGIKSVLELKNIVHNLLVLATKYDMNELKKSCEFILCEEINKANAVNVICS